MRHRATQLILPFEPALPGRQLILAPRLWPTRTPTTQQKMDREIARALNADGLLSAHGRPFSGGEVHLLRKRWNIPTVKINRTEHNPRQWPDGTYSVQGAAEALSISTQTVFKWLQRGRLSGHQITKGMPWQISLSNTQIVELRTQIRRTTLSKKEAS